MVTTVTVAVRSPGGTAHSRLPWQPQVWYHVRVGMVPSLAVSPRAVTY